MKHGLGKSLSRGVRRAFEHGALLVIPALCGLMVYDAWRPGGAAMWCERLRVAAQAGDVEGLRAAIRQGAELEDVDRTGWAPLHCAAGANQPRSVAALLEAGAPVSGGAGAAVSPLGVAAMMGHDEVAGVLLAHGADPNGQTRGFTPLCLVCQQPRASADLVRRLLKAGARVDGRSQGGQTALMAAAAAPDAELVRVLLAAGADRSAEDDAGRTALDYATDEGDAGTVAILLR